MTGGGGGSAALIDIMTIGCLGRCAGVVAERIGRGGH